MLGRTLAHGLVRHGIAPPNFALNYDWLPAAAVIGCAVAPRCSPSWPPDGAPPKCRPPSRSPTPRSSRGCSARAVIGGLLALAGAVPLFTVSVTTSTPDTAAATAEMTAILLVVAVGLLGPIFAYMVARLWAGARGDLARRRLPRLRQPAHRRRRFSSASTPLVLTVAMSCTLLFSTTTIEHAITQQRHAGLTGQLALTTTGPGLPTAAPSDVRAHPGVRSAVALTSTTLGPGLGDSDDTLPAQILAGGRGGGLDVGVTAGSLNALHGNTIALGRRRANAAHAHIGERVQIMLGDGTLAHATVVAIFSRDLAFGSAPPPSSSPVTKRSRCSGRSSSKQTAPPRSPGASTPSLRGIPD